MPTTKHMHTPEPLHFIEHKHRAGDSITATFVCKGDRTSKCHQYPDCDCERWPDTAEHEKQHPSVPHDECWVAVWMNTGDCADLCGPDGEPVRSGPIYTWFEDCVMWDYLEETPNA